MKDRTANRAIHITAVKQRRRTRDKPISYPKAFHASNRSDGIGASHLFSGASFLIAAANTACASGFTGEQVTTVVAGRAPRKLSSFQLVSGRTGRGQNPPPQFGQTLLITCSTQVRQNVHSNVQIIASSESGGRGLLQCSQVGLNCSAMPEVFRRPPARQATKRWRNTGCGKMKRYSPNKQFGQTL